MFQKLTLIVIKKQCFDLWYSTRDEHGIQNIVNSSSLISPPSTSDHILNLQLQDAEPRLQQENSDTNEELIKVRKYVLIFTKKMKHTNYKILRLILTSINILVQYTRYQSSTILLYHHN